LSSPGIDERSEPSHNEWVRAAYVLGPPRKYWHSAALSARLTRVLSARLTRGIVAGRENTAPSQGEFVGRRLLGDVRSIAENEMSGCRPRGRCQRDTVVGPGGLRFLDSWVSGFLDSLPPSSWGTPYRRVLGCLDFLTAAGKWPHVGGGSKLSLSSRLLARRIPSSRSQSRSRWSRSQADEDRWAAV
jgi:hypothetical protein